MLNLLLDRLIRARRADGEHGRLTLPEVLVGLVRDEIAEFPALRPHQRQAWHAFLVQLAALALHRAGRRDPPDDAGAWVDLLRGLTPQWPDEDEPWSLVADASAPALLQTPVPNGDISGFSGVVMTPDALDMLVTSKNHDLKAARMAPAEPDDWLFALVTLQTMEGVMGAGNYGISRMNSGYGSRAALGIVPPGGPGARFIRDVRVLVDARDEILSQRPFLRERDGIGLVWLEPWDGMSQLSMDDDAPVLDPFYIEICRRVRLVYAEGQISGRTTGSRRSCIDARARKGNVGDSWMPIDRTEGKAISIGSSGFPYDRITELMFDRSKYAPAVMQQIQPYDPENGLVLLACGIARGQGKTEGYHERAVPLARHVVPLMRRGETDQLARIARDRVEEIATLRGKILRPALISLMEKGPEKPDYNAPEPKRRATTWLDRLDRLVDKTFFPDLWKELAADEPEERAAVRTEWRREVAVRALRLLEEAADASPQAAMRRYRAIVRARGMFYGLLYRAFEDLRPEGRDDNAA